MIAALFLLALLLGFSAAGFLLGGAIYALLMSTGRIPLVGGLFRFLIKGPAPMAFPIKLCGWAISSGAMLIGLAIYQLIAGPVGSRWEFWAIFAAACITVLKNLERSAFFDVYKHVDLRKVAPLVGFGAADILLMGRLKQKIALQTYIDASVTNFFSLIVAFGLIVYSAGPLGLVDTDGKLPGLGASLLEPLRLLNFVEGGGVGYSGVEWQLLRGLAAFLIMLYLVLFISLGANLIADSIRIAEEDDAMEAGAAASIGEGGTPLAVESGPGAQAQAPAEPEPAPVPPPPPPEPEGPTATAAPPAPSTS